MLYLPIQLIRLICCGVLLFGCSSENPSGEEPQPTTPDIVMEIRSTTESSAEVGVTLQNADLGYCLLLDAEAPMPTLSDLRKGSRVESSMSITFEGLAAGSSYNVYGVAAIDGLYGAIRSVAITTSGVKDYGFPKEGVTAYLTTADRKSLLANIEAKPLDGDYDVDATLSVDSSTRYQSMEGFGPAITGSSAYNLLQLSDEHRNRILRDAFHPTEGLGYNYIRVSIGCSDFSLQEYTWCDQPGLEFFEVHDDDRNYLFPVLREILSINPDVKIIAAPWTAPLWMKIDRYSDEPYTKWAGGRLNPEYYDEYAQYLVMWVEEMELNGFEIESITPQNEPLHDGNSASTYMTWEHQRNFIKYHLGPAFERAGLDTKIWIYDHNFDVTDFVKNIYADKEASRYVEGSAWHAYGGSSSALSQIHSADPSKSIYFTEQSIGTWCPDFGDNLLWHIREVGIGTMNNYCRAIVLWNFMLDNNRGPNRPGGCTTCYGFVDCDASYDYNRLTYRSHWYAIGHLSKVIQRNAVRVKSSSSGVLASTFENGDGSLSAVVLNDSNEAKSLMVESPKGRFRVDMPARSVVSLLW